MRGLLLASAALAAEPSLRAPDAVLTYHCASGVGRQGWADLDGDEVLDFVAAGGLSPPYLQIWPSTVPTAVPIRLSMGADDQAVRGPIVHPGPPGLLAVELSDASGKTDVVELTVDPTTWTPIERWREPLVGNVVDYVGDVEGDGLPDLLVSDEVRLSSTGARVPLPPDVLDGRERYYVHAVGDVNADGSDDLVVGYREIVNRNIYLEYEGLDGPAALFLGSPTGFGADPLWVWDDPELAVGHSVVRPEGGDALVLTLVEENFVFASEHAELVVLHGIGTANPSLVQRIPASIPGYYVGAEWRDDGRHDWRLALYHGDAETLEVAVLASGLGWPVSATGVRWHRWDPDAALLDAHAHAYAADEMYDTPWIRRSATVATPLAQFWSADDVLRTYGWSPPEGAAPQPPGRPEDCGWPGPVLPPPSDTGVYDETVYRSPGVCGCGLSPSAGWPVWGALGLVAVARRPGRAARAAGGGAAAARPAYWTSA